MSLWSREELRVVLCPDQVVLLKARARRSLFGWQRTVLDKRIVPCAMRPDDAEPWHAAVAALNDALPGFASPAAYATVILSNHFVRYAMLPWSDAVNSAEEERAYAEHTFREIYGESADGWELRISPGQPGRPQVASAVEEQLLAALRQTGSPLHLRLDSIQPLLMQAYNQCQELLAGRDAWLVIAEQNYLCVMLLHKGMWAWVRTLRVGSDWAESLSAMLDREAFLANASPDIGDVFVSTPEHKIFAESARWHIQPMRPGYLPGLEAERDRQFAIYINR